MHARITVMAISAATIAASASGQVADLTVDPAQSSINARICLTPPTIGERCDTEASPIAGFVDVELDDYAFPSSIMLHDFSFALTNTMVYDFDWGPFIGKIKITLTDVAASYALPGLPEGPVPVEGTGDFVFPYVQTVMTGTGAYVGSGLVLGPLIGSGEFNLGDFGAMETAVAGVVKIVGGEVVLSGSFVFAVEGDLEGVETSLDGTATIVASGPIPEPDCPADFNGDTVVNTLDFVAFLNAFVAQSHTADFNGDTVVNTLDFVAFLNAFVAGCG
ncbi:MAG: hypothetical protein KIS87_03255 [Phycisphaeraceae bacterium]|nr:hypothetical protein [Phycisphaeraceae bacterium]